MKMLLFIFLMLPNFVFAELIINEISYNPEGTDAGFEWIEIHNTGDIAVSLEGYLLREQEVNHKLTSMSDAGYTVPAGGFAIIADNSTKFLTTFPGYPGVLLDSVFSLLNTGELLELLDPQQVLQFGIFYNPEKGGDGDGSTLGILLDEWVRAEPTPGFRNKTFTSAKPEDVPEDNPNEEEPPENPKEDSTSTTTVVTTSDKPILQPEKITAMLGTNKMLLAHVTYTFFGSGKNQQGAPLVSGKYFWNFGDGQIDEGKTTKHTYHTPGTYMLNLSISSGKSVDDVSVEVRVLESKFTVSHKDDLQTITLQNGLPYTIDISGFKLKAGESTFVFPSGSIIKKQTTIGLDSLSLKLSLEEAETLYFLSPNDYELSSFNLFAHKLTQNVLATTTKESASTEAPTQEIVYVKVIEESLGDDNTNSSSSEVVFESLPLSEKVTNQQAKLPQIQPYLYDALILVGVIGFSLALAFFHYRKRSRVPE